MKIKIGLNAFKETGLAMKKNGVIKLLFFSLVLFFIESHAMQEWIRTRLENLGITEARPASATEELKQIIERDGTLKKAGLTRIQQLVGMQADVNVTTSDGRTPLLVAIADYQPGDEPLIVRLLAEYADINKRYGQGMTPLALAAGDGKPALIPILVRFGADIHTKDNQGNTPLILAVRLDQNLAVQVAETLLNAGININAQNNNGETALYRAVQKKNYALIKFLIENGANATIANNQGQTPLSLAQANNDRLAITLLSPKTQKIL